MCNWENEKNEYCKGWHTWNNDSVLSYIRPLDGIGIRLCIKDYKNAMFMENILIGEDAAEVIPKAHAYDDSYTQLSVNWMDNHMEVESAAVDGELYVYIQTEDKRIKPSSLIVQGLSLYNMGATVVKGTDCMIVKCTDENVYIFVSEDENGELYVPINTPYISVDLIGAIGISTGEKKSVADIRSIIDRQRKLYEANAEKYRDNAELYKAMQICQAWDTIYDPVLKSPITTVSRIWNKQWGGYVLFCWDTYFGAIMQSLDNKVLAYSNVFAITDSVTEQGFVPNYVCQNGFKSFDRSQPPVGSTACLEIYNRYHEKWFLERVFDKLCGWNDWFYNNRRTPNGLLTWGSNPYELYYDHRLEHDGIGDWQGASYESGLDNSPMYENIPFDKENMIFMLDDVGLTGLYIQDCYALAKIAQIVDDKDKYELLSARISEMEDKLEQLWCDDFGMYLNRRTDTGDFEYRISPFHFHSLFSNKVDKAHVRRIVDEHLLNENEFWTKYPLPSISKSDPSYVKQTYWQGRVWAPMNYLVYLALKNAGEEAACEMLAQKSAELILKEWSEHGHIHENYDPETGEGCNNERSDRFYHWGGLLAYMSINV